MTYRKPLLYAYTVFQNCKIDQEYMCSCKLGAYLAKRNTWRILCDPTVATIWSCLLHGTVVISRV